VTTSTTLGTAVVQASIYTDLVMEGAVTINAGGTFLLEFAQDVSNATSSTVLNGSSCTFGRVS